MSKLLYILLALVVLLVLITVHEFGHYCAGKIFNFKINEFSIGFGPAIYKRERKDGEIFSIRALPLGGYCAFEGEDEDGKDRPGAFNTMAAWKRLVVLLSGVTFNFLFAVLTSAIFLMVSGFTTFRVTSTINQQGVQTMGFLKNDIVVAVNGKTIEAYRSFDDLTAKYGQDEDVVVTVERNGKIEDIVVRRQKFPAFYYVGYNEFFEDKIFSKNGDEYLPVDIDEFVEKINSISTEDEIVGTKEEPGTAGTGEALKSYLSSIYYKNGDNYIALDTQIETLLQGVKVKIDNQEQKVYPLAYSETGVSFGFIRQFVEKDYGFFEAVFKAVPYSFYLAKMVLFALVGLFVGAVPVSEAGGTVTAISQIAEITQMGMNYLLLLIPMLSVNLALFNVLPIPSLDGARSIFVIIEMIFKKPVPRHIEGWIHTIGLLVLFALVIFLDINHFVSASYILRL